MGNVIPFKTREELNKEKESQIREDWEAYLEWEKEALRMAREERESKGELEGMSEEDIQWLKKWMSQGLVNKEEI